jgi:S1-C subfamily serine protease
VKDLFRSTLNSRFRQPAALIAWLAGFIVGCPFGFGAEADVRRDPTVQAIASVMPAVVNIGTETVLEVRDPFEEMLREFWGPYYRRRPPETQYSLGSGVIIDEAGYILTNDHVVRRASRIWVKLSEEAGGEIFEAERVAGTARSDIALLKITSKPGRKLKAVRFAMDDDLLLGETVIALGNPFGLGGSASRGILSSKSRRPASEDGPLGVEDWLQTDAAINPGNSGGPLINLKGELIGLNVAVFRQGQGIGFAIPVRRVSEGLSEIFSLERERWWFGGRVRPTESGLSVTAVEPGSPAAKGGLRAGDFVESVNGREALGLVEFNQQLLGSGDKKDVKLEVRRDGSRLTLNLRLVRESALFNEALIRQKLGLSVQEITRELAQSMGLTTTEGLLIAGVDRDTEAERRGIRRGQIIVRLDGVVPADLVAAARMLHGRKAGDFVSLDLLALRRAGRILVPERGQVELKVR